MRKMLTNIIKQKIVELLPIEFKKSKKIIRTLLKNYEHKTKELDRFVHAAKESAVVLAGSLNQTNDALIAVNSKRNEFETN